MIVLKIIFTVIIIYVGLTIAGIVINFLLDDILLDWFDSLVHEFAEGLLIIFCIGVVFLIMGIFVAIVATIWI